MIRLVFSFLLFYVVNVTAQTIVPAGNVNGTWTAAGSPYQVQGLIVVQDGQTLTVDPGTTIEFATTGRLRVKGNVQALGTAQDPILFTAQNIANGWRSIFLDSVNVGSDSTIFEHCTIEYGKQSGLLQIRNFDKVRVENCTLQNGQAFVGAGIYLWQSDALIKNNTIQGNIAGDYAAGFYINGGAPLIQDNIITNNNGWYAGGAIYVTNYAVPVIHGNQITANTANTAGAIHLANWCDATITDNVFDGNSAYYDGGVLWASVADPVITGNTFTNNVAGDEGGALYFSYDCEAVCANNVFDGNQAKHGGGIFVNNNSIVSIYENVFINNFASFYGGALTISDESHADVIKCIFSNNYSNIKGGALQLEANCSPNIVNCTFTNNRSNYGGALYADLNINAAFNNCTFANNHANNRGGAIYLYWNASPVFTNCIFKGHTANDLGAVMYCQYYSNNLCSPSFVHCNIEGDQTGFVMNGNTLGPYINNIDADPFFVAPSSGAGELFDGISANWQISGISPCLNAGIPDTNGLLLPLTDLVGANRVILDTVDIGAYEVVLEAMILSQTSNQTLCEGDSALLTLTTGGVEPMSYQWQQDGTDIAGATNDTLSIAGSMLNQGMYTCIATNDFGADTTSAIEVTVFSSPVAMSLGSNTSFCEGNELILFATSGQYTYDWNDGSSSLDSIVVSTSGSYYYSISDSNSCSAYSDTIVVEVYSLPAFTLGPDVSQCDSTMIWLSSNITGVSYDWNNGQATTDSIGVNTSGTHTLIVSDANGCTFEDTIIVSFWPQPVVNLIADDTLCSGNPIVLYAGSGFVTYDWNNGFSSADSLLVNGSGSYFVAITDINNCTATDTANFYFHPLSAIDLGVDQMMCEGDSILLSAGAGFNTYTWSNGALGINSVYASTAGNWTVHVTDTNGCTNSDTVSIVVNPLPNVSVGPATTLCINAGALPLSTSPNGGTLSGPGIDQTTFYPDSAGIGTHLITYFYTDGNGCTATDSISMVVDGCLGISEIQTEQIQLFPNPNDGIFTIVLPYEVQNAWFSITDLTGSTVYSGELKGQQTNVDSGLSSGVYVLTLYIDNLKLTRKIVIN